MRVGVDARLLDKNTNTGISRYTEFILEYYISKYGEKNICVITNDYSLHYKSCEIKCVDYYPYNILHFFLYWRWVRGLKLDLLHVTFYSGLFKKIPHTKVIVTVHDLMYRIVHGFFDENFLVNKLKMKYFDFIVEKTIKSADVVLSVSESTKTDLLDNFNILSFCIPEFSIINTVEDVSILEELDVRKKNSFSIVETTVHIKIFNQL